MGMNRVTIPPMGTTDQINQPFNFISQLAVGETITAATVTSTLYAGTDSNPSAMISGAALISGTIVTQSIIGGLLGNIYLIRCVVTTSAGQSLRLTGYLAIVPDAP
jgi:hypothetical protein